MRKLYIIGNGFDLYHKLDTSYRSFGLYVKKNYTDIYSQLIEYYGFSELSECGGDPGGDILWNEFENNLSLLNSEMVLDAYSDSVASPGSPDFRDRDWGTFAIDIEMFVDSLTVDLFKAFKEFILHVEYPSLSSHLHLCLDENALYLSFNYTDTLEQYYKIREGNVNYIHNKAEIGGIEIILGHGVDPDNFEEKKPEPPEGISAEEMEMWMEQMADNFDYSYELGKQELLNYFSRTFKQTKDIIDSNTSFLNRMRDVDEIFILGHSLKEIDTPYFREIIKTVKSNSAFTISYYSEGERFLHKEKLLTLGIKETHINLIKLGELAIKV